MTTTATAATRKVWPLGVSILGLAALVLLLPPSWARQDTSGNGQQPDKAVRQVQPPKELDRARADLARAVAEMELLQAHLDMARATFEAQKDKLRLAEDRLKQAQKAAELTARKTVIEDKKGADQPAKVRARVIADEGGAGVEKRLSEMEKKLDEVLKELCGLRKSMGGGLTQAPKSSPLGGAWVEKLFERKTTHDFGKVEQGTQLKHSFPIKNLYAVPIEITDVRVSNGALSAVPTKKKLEPQEEASLDVIMNTKRLAGATNMKVYVLIGPEYLATAELQLSANVEE